MSDWSKPDSVRSLTLEFLTWISNRERTYADALEAWKSSCPRHPVFEDALVEGLIEIKDGTSIDHRVVRLTDIGKTILSANMRA